MAVGLPMKTTYANGDVWSSSDANDITGTVNLVGQTNNFYAGKNKIINGDFRVNQRQFTSTTSNGIFGLDRWQLVTDGTGGTTTYSVQTFATGTAPVAGYEGSTYARLLTSTFIGTNTFVALTQKMEDVRTFAGQTVTVSFWVKAASGTPKVFTYLSQNFGSGGSPSAQVIATPSANQTISTSWARYSFNIAVPSIAGKTIGTSGSNLNFTFLVSCGSAIGTPYSDVGIQNNTFDIWGVQIEAGSTATAFQTASGTIQGELALCQRYYYRATASTSFAYMNGLIGTTGTASGICNLTIPVTLRAAATAVDYSSLRFQAANDSGNQAVTALTINSATNNSVSPAFDVSCSSGLTSNAYYRLSANGSTSAYVGVSAELA
jgi:hypothetical protein